MQDILVSINCITYNHKPYIADALEGFLMQKTDFGFEILVYDDASTDGTANIIRHYAEQYPDLIKPVLQTENQYSQGVRVGCLNHKRALGTYIAACEGDDYWTDPYKLQHQVDYMRANPDCVLCAHAAHKVNVSRETVGALRPCTHDCDLLPEQVILTSGNLIATSSYLFLAEPVRQLPHFYHLSPVGDYALNIYLVSLGRIHYLDQFMSAYRVNVPGSVLNRHKQFSEDGKIELLQRRVRMLDEYQAYLNGRWQDLTDEKIRRLRFDMLALKSDLSRMTAPPYRDLYKKLRLASKAKHYARCYWPGLYRLVQKIQSARQA